MGGKTTKEIQAEIPGWSVWKDPIIGGETVEEVGVRADGVIVRALAAAASEPRSENPDLGYPEVARVLLFAHAHILRILAARWIGWRRGRGGVCAGDGERECGWGGSGRRGWMERWNRGFEEQPCPD